MAVVDLVVSNAARGEPKGYEKTESKSTLFEDEKYSYLSVYRSTGRVPTIV